MSVDRRRLAAHLADFAGVVRRELGPGWHTPRFGVLEDHKDDPPSLHLYIDAEYFQGLADAHKPPTPEKAE